jgi:hypothetical protein
LKPRGQAEIVEDFKHTLGSIYIPRGQAEIVEDLIYTYSRIAVTVGGDIHT